MREKRGSLRSDRPKEPTKLLTVRITEAERQAIQKAADKFADGNMSHYVRHAALNFKGAQ